MPETVYELKRPKFIIILMWFLMLIGEAVFGGCSIFIIVSLAREEYKQFDDPTSQLAGGVFVLCFCIIIFCLILSVAVYITVESAKQVDVYTESKMYQKIGNKIKFEIDYSNIASVKESYFNCLLLFCKEGFVKVGVKHVIKPQTIYMEFYKRKDIIKIVQLISDYKNRQ